MAPTDLSHGLVGTTVVYVSTSGHAYDAFVEALPENPWHAWTKLPTITLTFRDERGKLVRRSRVTPFKSGQSDRGRYRLKETT
jgi:hypothetical protein